MLAAQGILTARGGMTSHAAVVARGWGTPCVSGCVSLRLDYGAGQFQVDVPGRGVVTVSRGDTISIDGSTGQVMLGAVPLEEAQLPASLQSLLGWADDVRRLRVRTNADTPADAAKARAFGAEGIGLCRTEHMFFGPDRLLAVREMILADSAEARRGGARQDPADPAGGLRGHLPRDGRLPGDRPAAGPAAARVPAPDDGGAGGGRGRPGHSRGRRCSAGWRRWRSSNPMLGHRGVRLAITYPEIYEVQTRAILEAACAVARDGVVVIPEIMAPLVAMASELATTRVRLERVAEQVFEEQGMRLAYTIGTMIELPRACVTADEIAEHADFFSFGTNDLTQTTFGLSRDDAGHFLPAYLEGRVLDRDPFVELEPRRGGGPGGDRRHARACDAAGPEDRHLRRARRQSGVGGVLPCGGLRLRLLLAVSGPDRAPGGRAGGTRRMTPAPAIGTLAVGGSSCAARTGAWAPRGDMMGRR